MGIHVDGMAPQVNIIDKEYVSFSLLSRTLKGSPIYEPCLILETVMNDRSSHYRRKVEALIAVIENVLTDYLSRKSVEETLLLFRFIYSRAWKIILLDDRGKCKIVTYHLKFLFSRFERRVARKKLHQIIPSIQYLLKMIDDPWGGHTLYNIFNGKMYTNEEVLRLIEAEIRLVLIMRLEILLKAECLTKALRLTTACLSTINDLISDEQKHFKIYIKQLHLILLIKTKDTNEILNEVNKMSLRECLELVEVPLFYYKKSHKMMADIVANAALAAAVVRPVIEEENFQKLISHWFNLHQNCEGLLEPLKRIVIIAVSSQHIYYFCKVFIEKFGNSEKPYCIELFVRALTLNLNEVEKYRSIDDKERVIESEVQLSKGYIMLADYLKADILICRECLLTAFSLNPTFSCYEKLKVLATTGISMLSSALTCGKNEPSTYSNSNPLQQNYMSYKDDSEISTGILQTKNILQPWKKMDEEMLIMPINNYVSAEIDQFRGVLGVLSQPIPQTQKTKISEFDSLDETFHLTQQQKIQEVSLEAEEVILTNNNELKVNKKDIMKHELEDSLTVQPYDAQRMGISQTLCDDLSTVINSARYHVLTWDLGWSELSVRCMSYIELGKENRVAEKELRHLDIDYNLFKDRPKNQSNNIGIEKGFESFLPSPSPTSELKPLDPPKNKRSKQKMCNKIKIMDNSSLVKATISDNSKTKIADALSKLNVPKQLRYGVRRSPRIAHLDIGFQGNKSVINELHMRDVFNRDSNSLGKRKRDNLSNN